MTRADANALRREVEASGSHFFDRNTMRAFRSRLTTHVSESYDKRRVYFVTSERYDDSFPRMYTVRVWDRERKTVDTVGEFQEHATMQAAMRAMYEVIG